jgi:hypothetical protein
VPGSDGACPDAAVWAERIELGSVRIATVTRLEVGHSARSGPDLRTAGRRAPLAAMPLGCQTPAIEDRALEVQMRLADRGHHRAPSVPDLIVAATAPKSPDSPCSTSTRTSGSSPTSRVRTSSDSQPRRDDRPFVNFKHRERTLDRARTMGTVVSESSGRVSRRGRRQWTHTVPLRPGPKSERSARAIREQSRGLSLPAR